MSTVKLYFCDVREVDKDLTHVSENPQRVLSYRRHEDRVRCVTGELMIRSLVGKVIRNDGHQNIKPVSPGGPFFNLSHDRDFVVLGICDAWSVGVDIMKIQPSNPIVAVSDMLANLRNIFQLHEWEFIQSGCTDYEKLERFYILWTAKEAYVKCLGTGLYTEPIEISLYGFEHSLDLTISQCGKPASHSSNFKVRILNNLFPEYMVAICLGPTHLCDPSWTRLVEHVESLPMTAPDSILLDQPTAFSLNPFTK